MEWPLWSEATIQSEQKFKNEIKEPRESREKYKTETLEDKCLGGRSQQNHDNTEQRGCQVAAAEREREINSTTSKYTK